MEAPKPTRFFTEDPQITWRTGSKPDYSSVDALYMTERSKRHQEGSIEKIVENVIKTLEMEAEHKSVIKDWGSIGPSRFKVTVNGGPRSFDAEELARMGTYNAFLDGHILYHHPSRQEGGDVFRTAFSKGFAWEVLEVQSEKGANPFEEDTAREAEMAITVEDTVGVQATPPSRKRKTRSDLIDYLTDKTEKDDRFRSDEIRYKENKFDKEAQLREGELNLQKERLERDSKLREEELRLQRSQIELQRQQQQ